MTQERLELSLTKPRGTFYTPVYTEKRSKTAPKKQRFDKNGPEYPTVGIQNLYF